MSVVIENLSFTYSKKTPFEYKALDNVSLTINEGEFFGIIGHTGSGKSTLLQHFNALTRIQEGKISIAGIDLSPKKLDFKLLRKTVGMVFQYPEYQLFAESVYKDVVFGLKNFYKKDRKNKEAKILTEEEMKIRVRDAIELVGLDFDEVKNKSPFELSGGQKRRVAIAGVIVTKPKILILDEPTAGLDPIGKREILELLKKLQKGVTKTIIMISHDMNEVAENCDRVAVMNKGKIVDVKPPLELFDNTDKLVYMGLDIPSLAKISKELFIRGYDVDKICLEEEELAKQIIEVYKGESQ